MDKMNLEIERDVLEYGASLVGFSNITMLPVKVAYGLPRAVSIAVALNPVIVREIKDGPTLQYYEEYKRVNNLLTELCERVVCILARAGHRAEAVRATTEKFDPDSLSTRVQHKTIATRAGLGWIGKSALLITEEYGPAVRLASVLTDADIETCEPIISSRCGECHECVDRCPAGAIAGPNWTPGDPREAVYDAFTCLETARRLSGRQAINSTICGICINACPWTQRYLSRELDVTK
jgi:epoxyqueuosine reductase QueG